MSSIAKILKKSEDANEYSHASEKIYDAFNAKFYNAEAGVYETTFWRQKGTRTKYIIQDAQMDFNVKFSQRRKTDRTHKITPIIL